MGENIIRPKEEDLGKYSESARHSQLRVILEPITVLMRRDEVISRVRGKAL